jgi:hypothetical protein
MAMASLPLEYLCECPRQLPWIVARRSVAHRQVSEDQPATEQAGRLLQFCGRASGRAAIGQHYVDRKLRRVLREHLQMSMW